MTAADLTPPPDFTSAASGVWFAALADRLLNRSRLVVNGRPHRLIEVEAYYHSAAHPDPFAHRDPVQLHPGRWYFHRSRGAYRGGSFKGLDLTFGDGASFGGVLFRGLETPDGTVIDGPSLLVDHLLTTTGFPMVAALDAAIGTRHVWASDSPLSLVSVDDQPRRVWASLRVGLGLKTKQFRADDTTTISYLLRSDRFLTEPRKTKKGKPHLVLPLLAAGMPPDEVSRETGSPLAAVKRYAAAFAAGKDEPSAEPFFGAALGPADLCRLYGWWRANGGA